MYRCSDGKFRYIYKITCLEGSWKGRYYYGQHTTDYLPDGYFSSGKKINDYRKKYPHGYLREIISFHASEESLNKAEYDIIHPCLNNEMCLNIVEGGYYGRPSYETRKKISEKNKISHKGEKNGMYGKHHTEESKKKMFEAKVGPHPWNIGFTGKHHTEESKKKTSNSVSGNKNGMYGKHHSEDTKKKQSEARMGKTPGNKGKHKVFDNKELNIYHYE